MKSLSKIWGNFSKVFLSTDSYFVTSRLFLKRLYDPEKNFSSLFLAINTLSGAVDILPEKEGLFLEKLISHKISLSSIPKLFLKQLLKRGYIFPNSDTETFLFQTLITKVKFEKYQKDKVLGFFALDTTCPMQCEYCFEKKYEKQTKAFEKSQLNINSLDSAFDAFELILNNQQKEVDFVAGWGGEPLQEKLYKVNEAFIQKALSKGFPIAYFSNLALIGNNLKNILKRYSDKFIFIQTTLDALEKKHNQYRKLPNAFQKTVENIDELLQEGLPIKIRTNVGPHNIEEAPSLAQFYEEMGWFEYPKFEAYVTKAFDRYHDQEKSFIFNEDKALDSWLSLLDRYPSVRKMKSLKFAPSLYNILKALSLRQPFDLMQDSLELNIKPNISYCYTSRRCEYVFTGGPKYSIYNCAECTGINRYKIGSYYPKLIFDENQKKLWGMNQNIYEMRSIDVLERCKECKAATFCGGYCALEAVTANNDANKVYCRNAPQVIDNFLEKQKQKLFLRCKQLYEQTENYIL